MIKEHSHHEKEQYERAKEIFIQTISNNMNLYGVNASIGRLFGTLYFSDDPMTLDDMREALHMSKTSMSTGVRTLLDMKMVEPVFKKGVRKDLYTSTEDWYQSFTELFSSQWKSSTKKNIEEGEKVKEKFLEILEKTDDASLKDQIKKDIEKLEYAKSYYDWLLRFIDIVDSGEIFEYVPKEPKKKDGE